MNTVSFRPLVINLLDDADGIAEVTYQHLVEFADANFPNICDDIWTRTESAKSKNDGLRVYLEEHVAEELRKEDAQELLEIQEIEQLQDEKRGLYPDKIDIAN